MLSIELAERLNAGNAPQIVDVRTGFEFRMGYIPGAINAPAWKIILNLVKLPSDRNAELVVICEHGPRAEIARKLLGIRGYRNVTLLEGHMYGWRRDKYILE